MSYNNVGHLITSTVITLQHFATLHHTSPNYTSLHLSTLHFLSFTLHYPLICPNPSTFPIVLFPLISLNVILHYYTKLYILLLYISMLLYGAWSGVVVKALRYYSDGPGIDSRWCHWIFQWHIPSDRTMALGSTQPLVKMGTRKISCG